LPIRCRRAAHQRHSHPHGHACLVATRTGSPQSALRLGEEIAAELLARAGPDFFRALA
jgi:hypothetical protein